MMAFASLSRYIRRGAVIVGLAGSLGAGPALAAIDYTDLWWNPAEPGWGVNFVQAENFIFATFFVYDAANKPTWYTGQMSRDANGIWKGPLYQSTGSYFGAPYNATLRDIDQVGSVTFITSSESTGSLAYNVDAVTVAKAVERQTLQMINIAGTYTGALITDTYNCDDGSPVRTLKRFVDASASQAVGGPSQLSFSFAGGGTCSFNGNATQAGQLFRMDNATYTCGTGPAIVYELKATGQGLEGRWRAPVAGGCTEFGVFAAVLK